MLAITYLYHYVAAPSSPPDSLRVSSTSLTSISITWGDVPCRERNVDMITGYRVKYHSNHSNPHGNQIDEINRTFTASELIPRTNYTFEVRAFYNHSTNNFTVGPLANITGVTKVPKGS